MVLGEFGLAKYHHPSAERNCGKTHGSMAAARPSEFMGNEVSTHKPIIQKHQVAQHERRRNRGGEKFSVKLQIAKIWLKLFNVSMLVWSTLGLLHQEIKFNYQISTDIKKK